ncbi:MAG TPA: serine/threonine-protein kinase [Polyangia bacterium]|jgi:hypothetical protein|nr:serine/threonine-protein kinase [Polyangia bacterium]
MPTLLALDRVLARNTEDTLGRYQLLGRLGAGGMAEVFVARVGELPGMQSLVAVKRILPHLADDEAFVALFRREAQISLRLRHRAIARVLEVGRAGTSWFLAMELVAGESLAHLLRAEREQGIAVDPQLVAWVGAEIASALHHAHALTDGASALEVIHRDVSPQNLLLSFDGAAKLIDFGVARCVRLSEATRTVVMRGKLAYASPEQQSAGRLDGRSDLFSLAVVLHEWLAGAPLFGRDSDAATIQAMQTAPIPPLPRTPRLSTVLARALDREPARRYPDGESFADALLAAIDGRPASPERLVAAHLGALFPDRKLRWQAITVAREGDAAALELAKPSHGGTVRGTSAPLPVADDSAAEMAAETKLADPPVQRRVRWPWAAAAAAVGLIALLTNWVRHDPAVAVHSPAPAPPLAAAPALPNAAPTTTLPDPTAFHAAPALAPPQKAAATPRPSREKINHAPARPSHGHRRHPTAPTTATSAGATAPVPRRHTVINELERSPYETAE